MTDALYRWPCRPPPNTRADTRTDPVPPVSPVRVTTKYEVRGGADPRRRPTTTGRTGLLMMLSSSIPRYVVSGVSSDAHMWNLVFLQLVLEDRGGEVINLGACAPDEIIIEECRRSRPDVLVVSTVNGHGHLDGLRLIRKIRSDQELSSLRVVIGGKLGVHGAENTRFDAELVANGFDGVFEADAGLTEFEKFLSVPTARPRAELAGVREGEA
ncbi:cobalamin B12-binding domain-containing protein [Frankia sp. Cas4]|uniref:cobalamin B12-binding domain-containing protein n=1 Tax=Frankia sp. Cas4 TaxID=3073927 RepID=UPI002AD2DDF4|nr:cobalamin-dependent protein [Frankia sp. Cas4]